MRLFFAVPLPAAPRDAIDAALAPARAKLDAAPIAWEPAAKLHVTLKFLGEVDPPPIESLASVAAEVVAAQAPFALSLAGLSAFPDARAPSILWVRIVDGADALESLAHALDERLGALGFAREVRPYVAHVTCARARSAAGTRALASWLESLASLEASTALVPFLTVVDRVTLFESRGHAHHPVVEKALGR